MPQQTAYTQPQNIRLRTPNKLTVNRYANEIAEAVNRMSVLPKFGQVLDQATPPPTPAEDSTLPVPQYQFMVLQAVSQNTLGADYMQSHGLII